MGRLSFVGLGLGSKGLSLQGLEELRDADVIYLEYYTTPHEPSLLSSLEESTRKPMTVVDREFVEDGSKILSDARIKNVVLAVPGDPMIATTHNELRVRAIRAGVETRLIHAATVASALASASGLHYYKFGRTITVTRELAAQPSQVYNILHENLLQGAHSLILLEYDVSGSEGVSPGGAVEGLLNAERSFKRGVVGAETFGLVLSRVGRSDAIFRAGQFSDLIAAEYGNPPFSLIVPGHLHFTEIDAISAIFSVPEASVRDNSEGVKRTAQTLVPKYVEKTRRALESVRGKIGPQYGAVLENAELYTRDAESFLAKGEDELAMLSIGYAEGLLDSLSFSGTVRIDW
jgi:diphthine synthase